MLQCCLWEARFRWRTIGTALQIDQSTLEVIQGNDSSRVDNQFIEMLWTWLRRASPVPCWKALVEALESIDFQACLKGTLNCAIRLPLYILIVFVLAIEITPESDLKSHEMRETKYTDQENSLVAHVSVRIISTMPI